MIFSKETDNYYALKLMKKVEIVRLRQVNHVKSERAILCRIHHPFIVNVVSVFKGRTIIYIRCKIFICVDGLRLWGGIT